MFWNGWRTSGFTEAFGKRDDGIVLHGGRIVLVGGKH